MEKFERIDNMICGNLNIFKKEVEVLSYIKFRTSGFRFNEVVRNGFSKFEFKSFLKAYVTYVCISIFPVHLFRCFLKFDETVYTSLHSQDSSIDASGRC